MSSKQPTIVVAGDVCVDWLQYPQKEKDTGLNWELYPGTNMIAIPGGALALAEFLRKSTKAIVASAELPEINYLSPKQVIHSNTEIDFRPYSIDPKDKGKSTYRVKEYKGFVGPVSCSEFSIVKNDNPDANIVVLDDAGNGFRDNQQYWPKAIIEEGKKPIIIYKVSRPLAQGKLWEYVCKNHADRLIVILNSNDLRSTGVNISRCLSWEKTALDFVWQMASNPKLKPLASCSNLIIRFGLDGVIHYTKKDNKIQSRLYFDPLIIEDEFKSKYPGEMQYIFSTFTAALISKIAASDTNENLEKTIPDGIRNGLSSARRLFRLGFGGKANEPAIPIAEVFEEKNSDNFAEITIPNPTVPEPADPNFWCILKEIKGTELEDMAYDIVLKGEKGALGQVPVAQFGKLRTVDRSEIESFRSISNLMHEYINAKNPPRPLSIAVFGSPGSGKSFGITEVANSIAPDSIVKIEFNISQFKTNLDLIGAFHKVRDIALEGKIPLVFFDEFDSYFEGNYGWLKYFLSPMQDGKFREGETMHPIGKAIFVFAGGICNSFTKFATEPTKDQDIAEYKNQKVPDFVSRLRGYVNILGPNCSDGNETLFIIRRAMLLRSFLERKTKQIVDGNNQIRIDQGVLRALIKVPKYNHGARSMEAIIDMSTLSDNSSWEQAYLPPKEQLRLHVDDEMFSRLVVRDVLLGAARESIAKAIHEQYRKEQAKDKPESDPSMQPWENLNENLKESNRKQADNIPEALRKAGYGFAPVTGRETKIIEFSPDDVEIMAIGEHDRWVSERRASGWTPNETKDVEKKQSPYLVDWEKLSQETKEIDRKAIRALPEILASAKFEIYKIR